MIAPRDLEHDAPAILEEKECIRPVHSLFLVLCRHDSERPRLVRNDHWSTLEELKDLHFEQRRTERLAVRVKRQ